MPTIQLFDKISVDELENNIWVFTQVYNNVSAVDGMKAHVQCDRNYSEPFPVTNGVKQGCEKHI